MTDGGSTSTSADGTYKIGMIYPMSGGNALFGNAMVSATEIAVDMINEAGGVNGTQIQLVVGDGATSSEASTEATRMIDSEGVNVIIGSMSSGNANAIRSVTERSNVILWETSAVADNVLDGNSGDVPNLRPRQLSRLQCGEIPLRMSWPTTWAKSPQS